MNRGDEVAVKQVSDHPIEDIFGTEIRAGDVYWVFKKDVVSFINLTRYLIEHQQVDCFKAAD